MPSAKNSPMEFHHLNIQGLPYDNYHKLDLLSNYLCIDDNVSKFFAVTETHLRPSDSDQLFSIPGYCLFRSDRPDIHEKSVKHLGVILDEHLSWADHVKKVQKNVRYGISLLNRVKVGLPTSQRIALFYAFVQSHLDYCSTVWSGASVRLRDKLAAMHRNGVRAAANYAKIPTESFMNQHGILPLFTRWKQKEAIWLYKIKHPEKFHVPQYISEMVEFDDRIKPYNLRSRNRILIKAVAKKKVGETTFAWKLNKLWTFFVDSNFSDLFHIHTVGAFKQALNRVNFV
ncbi:uncharacterized protein LOC129594428 [Paramacrobiotus metropolitanus]|uniref:uncharacterized protein LOC129594428 n=1 Tax=Paramacrobiotus metropolitanus TaxID=2943436 RepID=UPI002445C04A|nr:uncharacterized protein LOC129594428 [Paramacrobiotus metropolitanus]